jgi:hypothetical protein
MNVLQDILDQAEGLLARLESMKVEVDQAEAIAGQLRRIETTSKRQRRTVETRIQTVKEQAMRMCAPMNDERFHILEGERAVKVYPGKVREVADRYGWTN